MAHIHEKIDFTASVLIVHKNKVLLHKHSKLGMWLQIGGHIELDEDPNEAAVREAKEEVGLDVVLWNGSQKSVSIESRGKELIPPVALNRHSFSAEHEHIDLLYFATSDTDQVIPEQPTDEWRWLTRDEVDALSPLPPEIKFYAKLALETLRE